MMKLRASFALGWALMLHLIAALAFFTYQPSAESPQGRAGNGAGIEIRLGSPEASAPVMPETAGLLKLSAAESKPHGENRLPSRLPPAQPGGQGGDQYLALVRSYLAAQAALTPFTGSGTVELKFTIVAGGQVTDAAIARSSGDAVLDATALALLERASPLPQPPRGNALTLSVPVEFAR